MKFVCNLKMGLNKKYVLVIVTFFLGIFKQLMIAKMDHRRKLKLHE